MFSKESKVERFDVEIVDRNAQYTAVQSLSGFQLVRYTSRNLQNGDVVKLM